MAARGYVPDAGDVVWLESDPQAGHEQAALPSSSVQRRTTAKRA